MLHRRPEPKRSGLFVSGVVEGHGIANRRLIACSHYRVHRAFSLASAHHDAHLFGRVLVCQPQIIDHLIEVRRFSGLQGYQRALIVLAAEMPVALDLDVRQAAFDNHEMNRTGLECLLGQKHLDGVETPCRILLLERLQGLLHGSEITSRSGVGRQHPVQHLLRKDRIAVRNVVSDIEQQRPSPVCWRSRIAGSACNG